MTSTAPRHYLPWLLGLLLVMAILLVFGAVVHYDFVIWDDDIHVYANPRFQPVTWAHLRAFWQAPYAQLYIPFTYTVWAALAWLTQTFTPGPLTAEAFHRCNVLLHMGSALLVYRLGYLVLSRKQPTGQASVTWAAAAGALLFGLHPLQVEAVVWVSGLKDVLYGWWALLALWQYLEYARRPQGWQRWLHYGLAVLAFSLALLAKPAAVVVPGMAWLLDVRGVGRSWQQAARAVAGWLLLAALWAVWTKGQQPDAVIEFITPLWARPLIVTDALIFYLKQLLWPWQLGPDYGRTPQAVLAHGWRILYGVGSLGLVGLGVWQWRTCRYWLWLAVGIFIVGVFPVLGIIPFVFQAYSTVADRYVYLAMLGPALGFGLCLQHQPSRQRAWLVGVVLLGLLGWRSATQVRVWQDTAILFTHALQVNPRSNLAHNNLGLFVAQQGQLDRAIAHFQAAIALKPTAHEAHYNLGKALHHQGRLDAAIDRYTRALQLRPGWAEAHNNLGVALAAQGKPAEAIAHYTQALVGKPDWADVYYNLGDALAQQGRSTEAMVAYQAALHWRPDWPQAASRVTQILTTLQSSTPHVQQESHGDAVR